MRHCRARSDAAAGGNSGMVVIETPAFREAHAVERVGAIIDEPR